jgi:hypothetical protein
MAKAGPGGGSPASLGLIESTGRQVIMMAPSSSAVDVLKGEGFSKSETFQKFQSDPLIQDVARGSVLWVDEAGFLSAQQMRWIVSYASENGCRL